MRKLSKIFNKIFLYRVIIDIVAYSDYHVTKTRKV